MKFSIEIKDEKQIELIEKLRGQKTAKEFVQLCAEAGLKLAAQPKQTNRVKFASSKAEFLALDVAAITEVLKTKDAKHPVTLEVSRLVAAYTAQLQKLAKKNGNRLPSKMQVNTKAAIEKVAFQITVQAINDFTKKQKAAAAK